MQSKVRAIIKREIDENIDIVLEKPKKKDLGHFATPVAFSLAKIKKSNPNELAKSLSENLRKYAEFKSVNAMNGFINITLSVDFLRQCALAFLHNADSNELESKERILLEFVSANPTGGLHIGHARGAVYGDALARIGTFLGYSITKEYYINDAGAQISLLGLSIMLVGREQILKQAVVYPESYYRGEYIVDLAHLASEHFGKDIFKNDDNIAVLATFGKDEMLKEIKANLSQVGIVFDNFVSEKSLYPRWEETLKILESKGGTYKDNHKIWIASSKLNDKEDRVIVRENGEPTYLAGDIIYHKDKFERGFSRYINIWGADHHGYIARVKAALHFMGFDENKLEILLSQMVSLLKSGKPYKMSKRAGNFILMKEVVDEIGADALRFIFLSKKPDTHLEFDVSDLKKQDMSNPIYYINYANARIHTMMKKSSAKPLDKNNPLVLNDEAVYLLFSTLCLPQVLQSSFRDREVQKVCEYLKSLAQLFHSYYNAHKILGSNNESSLLFVCKVVSHSITLGLALLGIQAKTAM